MLPLVSLTLFLPLVGAVLILCLPKPTARTVHSIAIVSAALTLVGALAMWLQGVSGDGFSQVEELQWIPAIGAAYRVGVDGISLPLVLLSAVLFLVAVIYTSSLRERPRAYIALVLLLETASIGTFTALDGILFYVFFEGVQRPVGCSIGHVKEERLGAVSVILNHIHGVVADGVGQIVAGWL